MDSELAPPAPGRAAHPHRRRTIALAVLGAIPALALLACALFAIPAFAPVRAWLLGRSLPVLTAAWPGRIEYRALRWPSLGRIELDGGRWIDRGDTLAVAERVAVALAPGRLWQRDLVVRELSLESSWLDLVAIRGRLARLPHHDARGNSRGFLRAGPVPGLPSFAIESLRLELTRVRTDTTGLPGRLSLDAALRALAATPPALIVRRLAAEHPASGLRVNDARLTFDLAGAGQVSASGHGRWRERIAFTLEGAKDPDGGFHVAIADGQQPLRSGGHGLFLRGRFLGGDPRFRSVEIPELTARFTDLELHGHWRVRQDRNDGVLHAEVKSLRGVPAALLPSPLPDSVHAVADARFTGTWAALQVRLLARGRFHYSGVTYERASLAAAGALGAESRLRFALRVTVPPARVHATGELDTDAQAFRVRVTPVRLDAVSPAPDAPDASVAVDFSDLPRTDLRALAPAIVLERASGRLWIRHLLVTGDFGEGRADARLDDGAGPFTAALAWPELPRWLQAALPVDGARLDSLRVAWRRAGALGLDARGRFAATAPRCVAELAFRLPGPATFAAMLPEGARVADLGPLEGQAHLEQRTDAWQGTANFGRTAWLSRGELEGHQSGEELVLDRLDAALPGITARVRSTLAGSRTEGTVDVRIEDAVFLSRFLPQAAPWELHAAIRGRMSGDARAPDLDLAVLAAARDSAIVLPELRGRVRTLRGRLARMDLRAPQGARAGAIPLDTLWVRFADDGPAPGSAPGAGRFAVAASGPDVAWSQAGVVRTAPALVIATDSLEMRIGDKEWRSRRPFTFAPLADGFEIHGLDLAGSLGTLTADGLATRESSALAAHAELHVPDLPAWAGIPSGLVPSALTLDLRPQRGDSLELVLELRGLQVAARDHLAAHLRCVGRPADMFATLRVEDGAGAMLELEARVPGRLTILAPRTPGADGVLAIRAHLQNFPLPPSLTDPMRVPGYLDRGGLRRTLALDGDLRLDGTAARPAGELTGVVTFPAWKALRKDRIELRARLDARGEPAGVTATFAGSRDGKSTLTGKLDLPLRVDGSRMTASPIPGRTMAFVLDAAALPLQMLEPFAIGLRQLTGEAGVHVDASGPPLDPEFHARVQVRSLQARAPDHSSLAARGEVTATGTLSAPVVRGRIEIEHGILQLPEPQKLLHPTTGQALLLQRKGVIRSNPPDRIHSGTPAVVVGTEGGGAAPVGAVLSASGAGPDAVAPIPAGSDLLRGLDLQVKIVASGGTRVHGRGVDAELGGELELVQKDGVPTLLGELQVRGGGMDLYGRRMELDRGTLTFYGGSTLDPALDVTLSRRTSGIDISAHVTGTAMRPTVVIDSDPPLGQSEIVSYLLFDRPLEDLDAAQNQRIEERATGQAEALLAAQLTGRISESLGLDLLTYQRSQSDSTGSGSPTITLGKYLTPQILVKVEQDFDAARGFDVVLEYWIRRGLKLSTHAQENRSGLGIDWSRDY